MNENIVELTKKLIQFKTVGDNYEEKRKIIDFIKKEFEGHKVYIKEFNFRKSPSIIINLRRERFPFIFLNGHLDVVPAEEKQFIPRVTNSRIYGRGAGDMKGSCSVMIETMKYFSKEKNPPSLGLMLTGDEETGGMYGTKVLLNKYKSSFAIIPDGGKNLKTIILNQKGIIHIKIWAHGKAGHGSRPFLGENAIEKIIDIYHKIKEVIPDSEKGKWENTVNLGKIQGGEVINKIPHYAEAYFDIRFINSFEREKIIEKIKTITSNFKIVASGNASNQEVTELIEAYKRIAQKEIRSKIVYSKVEGASDARFFAEKNIPILVTSIKSGNKHSKNEWADIKQMNQFYNILIKFIGEFRDLR